MARILRSPRLPWPRGNDHRPIDSWEDGGDAHSSATLAVECVGLPRRSWLRHAVLCEVGTDDGERSREGSHRILFRATFARGDSVEHCPWSIVRGAQAVRGACTVVGGFVDGFTEPVGYAEAILPRYPVSPYQCDVSSGLRRGTRVGDNGLRGLKERQFRSIVNLNSERPRDNRSVAAEAGLGRGRVPHGGARMADGTSDRRGQRFRRLGTGADMLPQTVRGGSGCGPDPRVPAAAGDSEGVPLLWAVAAWRPSTRGALIREDPRWTISRPPRLSAIS